MLELSQLLELLPAAFQESRLPLPGRQAGKVRDWYSLSGITSENPQRLIVTTDRLSAFDRNLSVVPFKGQVLNQLSAWWFANSIDIIPNHVRSLPDPNAVVALEVEPFLVEVIVRGYITGVTSTALWYRYSLGEREIYGYSFPEGLRKNQALPEPIITPTTKGSATGHDERITCQQVTSLGLLDPLTWDVVQAAALALFKRGQETAARAGMILVDTKYEFGRAPDGRVLLIDEVHTPDSSRFWSASGYAESVENGQEPQNFDKEFIRLAYDAKGYRGEGDAPHMPADLWAAASQRYIHIFELLTGEVFQPGSYPVEPRLEANLKKAKLI
jgi:phosphoribosylaminoimidazole-succinocarboxamide synthase